MSASVVVGLDIGTTSSKAVTWLASRRGGPFAEQPTPWHTSDCGRTEIDPYRLVDVAVDLISSAVRAAESAWGPVRVRAIGVTGLAESGVLLDGAGAACSAPVIAWFDRRLAGLSSSSWPGRPLNSPRPSKAPRACPGRARPPWPSCSGCAPAGIRPGRP